MNGTVRFQILGSGAGDANFGTADAAGLPPRDQRRFCSNLLAPDLLIDFNEHTAGALSSCGIDPATITCLLVSHGHFDHFHPLEIIAFANALPHPLRVLGSGMVVEALELCREAVYDRATGRYVRRVGPWNLQVERLEPGRAVTAGAARITPLLANHCMNKPYGIMEQQALSYLIEMNGRTLFYGLDSSYLLPRTGQALAGTHLDLAVMDATFGPRDIDPTLSGHHNWAMLDETLAELRQAGCVDEATVVVADHLSCANVGPHDEVAAQQAQRGITLAHDGLVLTL